MKKVSLLSLVVVMASALILGCSGKPSGFPKVSPCTITVTNGSDPIEGVDVALIPDTPISGVIVGGKTDASGVCVVKTTYANFSAPGSPEGTFKVQLRKDPEPTKPELTADDMASMDRSEIDKYNALRDAEIKSLPKVVPADLTSAQTTPVSVSVPADKEKAIDVAEFF